MEFFPPKFPCHGKIFSKTSIPWKFIEGRKGGEKRCLSDSRASGQMDTALGNSGKEFFIV